MSLTFFGDLSSKGPLIISEQAKSTDKMIETRMNESFNFFWKDIIQVTLFESTNNHLFVKYSVFFQSLLFAAHPKTTGKLMTWTCFLIKELTIIPTFLPFTSYCKMQNNSKCKIMQVAKLCKVQNNATCKNIERETLCNVQN